MRRGVLTLAIAAAVLSATVAADAQALKFLQNDDYTGGAFSCNSSLGPSEMLAARFTASPADYPYRIDRIRVLACSSTVDAFAVDIWQDDADTLDPGPALWISASAWQLDPGVTFYDIILSNELSPPPLITGGTIRVALLDMLLGGYGFGVDSAITPHRNFVRTYPTFAWQYAESAGVSGDWILRLGIVSDLIFKDGFQ
jgi:hypothetical protein